MCISWWKNFNYQDAMYVREKKNRPSCYSENLRKSDIIRSVKKRRAALRKSDIIRIVKKNYVRRIRGGPCRMASYVRYNCPLKSKYHFLWPEDATLNYCLDFLPGWEFEGIVVEDFFLWRCSPTRTMASFLMRFLDHTQPRITVGRTPLDEWSASRRDLYLTTHNTNNKHPCARWDSNPQSQQASGSKPTP